MIKTLLFKKIKRKWYLDLPGFNSGWRHNELSLTVVDKRMFKMVEHISDGDDVLKVVVSDEEIEDFDGVIEIIEGRTRREEGRFYEFTNKDKNSLDVWICHTMLRAMSDEYPQKLWIKKI